MKRRSKKAVLFLVAIAGVLAVLYLMASCTDYGPVLYARSAWTKTGFGSFPVSKNHCKRAVVVDG